MRKFFVRSDRIPAYTLCENDEAASALQNIALLIGTKQGTVPMYREFGLPMEFLGQPEAIARTIAAREIDEAIERFEPRATVNDIQFESSISGRIILVLEVSI